LYFDSNASGNGSVVIRFNHTKFPPPNGYDPNGDFAALGLTSGVSAPYSYERMIPFSWSCSAFVGMRGGMIWHYNVVNFNNFQHCDSLSVYRIEVARGPLIQYFNRPLAGLNANNMQSFLQDSTLVGVSGVSVTNQLTQSGLSTGMPHYYPYRFVSANPIYYNKGYSVDETAFKSYSVEIQQVSAGTEAKSGLLNRYVSIGTDFNVFFFFLNVPTVYIYNYSPTPA
jgi:hypothetical protein